MSATTYGSFQPTAASVDFSVDVGFLPRNAMTALRAAGAIFWCTSRCAIASTKGAYVVGIGLGSSVASAGACSIGVLPGLLGSTFPTGHHCPANAMCRFQRSSVWLVDCQSTATSE